MVASGAMVAAGLAALAPTASADDPHGTPGVKVASKHLSAKAAGTRPRALGAKATPGEPGDTLPAGVPKSGRYAFLLKLSPPSTAAAYHGALSKGKAAAASAAKDQLATVRTAQNRVIAALPAKSAVLYRTHAVLAGVSVVTDVKNYRALTRLAGVSAVYPIAPKSPSNAYAVPLQGAPTAWQAHSNLGADSTVAIIDTGIDYTHANFGGAGTVSAYATAKAAAGASPDFPSAKVVGGYDLAGDDYNGDPTDPGYNPVPTPDLYPLDCDGHGSHVAGTVAGYGENADGSTYAGAYNESTPFDTMRIGPGMAPDAKLYALRVFGCAGSTDLVAAAIDRAADPNQDGITTDHVDVVNMSLGSDYGSPQDGDSVVTEAAASLMTMVVASGNAGDLYDVGGSPGNAPSALTVAASEDNYAQLDSLVVSAPAGIAGEYASEHSIAYDWATDPDLSGDVVRVQQSTNLDGCDPLDTADAAAVNGHIAFVEWTDDDVSRRCGSVKRSGNLADAGATGFIFGDDSESFAGGITGSDVIPGVLVAKSGADAIRARLVANQTVTISGTVSNGFQQLLSGRDDTLASFSSRGIGDAGNVKPDVTAVGGTVFSTGSGTGKEGINESGTSMATPMVAGTAALVRTAHPGWAPKLVKADIMNTAGQDVFTGQNHAGARYAPQRVGAGRIQVDQSLDNDVLAYVVGDGGAVSASFGPQAVSAPTTLQKTIQVQNTTGGSKTYDVAYTARTTVPGATYSVSPSSVTVPGGETRDVTLTLHLDPAAMTKTIDPTVDPAPGGLPRQFQADASGIVELTSAGLPSLRVPVYAAPRPASTMTQPATLTLPAGTMQQARLPLTGHPVDQGSGATTIQSTVAGFELQATSGPAPDCGGLVTSGCVNFPDERSADLARVGVTSDAPQLTANGDNPLTDGGMAYFAINTQGRWRTAASAQEFDIYIDGDGDGNPDAVAFNTRFPTADSDVMVSELVDLTTGDILDIEPINASLGDTDTALFDSDTMVMPVAIGAIPGVTSNQSRIKYAVYSFSPYQSDPVDAVGDPQMLTFDVLHPGVTLAGSYNGTSSPVLFPDAPASVVNLRRDTAAYQADGGLGAMVVHFHNALGTKTQVVNLNTVATVGLSLVPSQAQRAEQVTATVTVPAGSGGPATGAVVLKQGATTLASGTVVNGTASLTFALNTAGTFPIHAEYAGDSTHGAGVSADVNLRVAKTIPAVGLQLNRTTVHVGKRIRATVQVSTVAGIAATGPVSIIRPNGRVLADGTMVNGVAVLKWKSTLKRSYRVLAVYRGDDNYLDGTSGTVRVRVLR
ncbi:peptidase S8 [Nocardioides pocheonensis]|uniref:Peptidase S8 n=1 Tax=Nocardioides pocheonensis TaxID=661485 RepID=A0A3N0GLU1_9ACTN|nr:peptidase S8 [Nocardioides pocheonensis]